VTSCRDEVPLPAACCYTFRPSEGDRDAGRERRPFWLYLTHGLTQWPSREARRAARDSGNKCSGAGVEFGLMTDEPAPWAVSLLCRVRAFEHESRAHGRRPFERGDRIPFEFESLEPGKERWAIGGADGPSADAVGSARSLVFWPYLSPYATFTTESGTFEIRIATTISGPELALAQETSSCHALLLLDWAGVGQVSRPRRPSVTELPGWEKRWDEISVMPFEDAKQALRQIARRGKHPT
jgi:hypothetical protein